MVERSAWSGSAADLYVPPILPMTKRSAGWPKTPRALAGRLRRAQTFLRALGIDIAFNREGRAGSRIIRIRATQEIPSVPSAASATSLHRDQPVTFATTTLAPI